MSQQKTTIADVARAAQVSPTTVARVIHNSGYVSDENRKRIVDAIEITGYRPNLQARSLRLQKSFTLGLVLSSARQNPFYTHISHAIRTAASAVGYSMLTVNHSYSAETEINGIRQFLDHAVEAVILCHAMNKAHLTPLIEARIPLIQVERQDVKQANYVSIDPQPGMLAAVEELVAQGHKRIAFVGARPAYSSEDQGIILAEQRRIDAFMSSVQSCGLDPADCPTILGEYFSSKNGSILPGRQLASELMDGGFIKVTAIVAGSDVLAAGLLQALYDQGLRVPQDVSLVGYDDSIAQFMSPALSSIAQPYSAIGTGVINLVKEIVADDNKHKASRTRSVSTSFIMRESIGAPSMEKRSA